MPLRGPETGTSREMFRAAHHRIRLAGLTPEASVFTDEGLHRYLITVLHGDPGPAPLRDIAAWDSFFWELRGQAVRPIVFRNLVEASLADQPPPAVMESLRKEFLKFRARQLLEDHQLKEFITALHNEGITPILLKGAALSRTLYPDPGMRPGSDIDLLVPPDQIPSCTRVFLDMGYRIPYDAYALGGIQYHHQNFYSVPGGVQRIPVEVHWRLDAGLGMKPDRSIDEIFHRSITVDFGSFSFRTLDPVDHFLYCAHHALFQHAPMVRLSWIFDLSLLMKEIKTGDQWKRLADQSVAWNARLAVEKGIMLADYWVGVHCPSEMADFSAWPGPSPSERVAWNLAPWGNGITDGLLKCAGCPSVKGKAEYLMGVLFPCPAIMRADFPHSTPWGLPLSHFRRWKALLDEM